MTTGDSREPDVQYDFGSNWRRYLEGSLSEERVALAKQSLVDFLGTPDLSGRGFIDIGCGSGLFSYAAFLLGAREIVSVDVNPNSIACCTTLREGSGSPEHWRILQGSVLDGDFVASLGTFDIVYSWGVLHHTGAMWPAISNAASRVAPGGVFYLAIYNTAHGHGFHSAGRPGSSRFWEWEKKLYVKLPTIAQRAVDGVAAEGMAFGYLLRGKNPVTEIRNYKTRGMSWMVDIREWLGGYPYEHATVEEICAYNDEHFGFTLENVNGTDSLINNEFLFRKAAV